MAEHCFISYSNADGLPFASQLANDLQGRQPNIKVWFDKNDLDAGEPWDTQIAEAIRDCKCLLFVMTDDSVTDNSVCKDEWTWALKYKKPIIPLHFHLKADLPFRLNNLQYIEFARDFSSGISQLRDRITNLDSPKGILDQLKHRLEDAMRDLRRASEADKPRIQTEMEELTKQIELQKKIVEDPIAAAEQTQKNIEAGLERERQPEKPVTAKTSTKFINPPPGIAPNYFQDRSVETEQIVHFLQDDSQRLMTIVGRGGVGKTAMVCRLLKGLEGGELPDGLGSMKVDGIVYLSESGSHRVNFANLFYDLCKLLPADDVNALDAIYKNPQASTASKMSALLDKFTAGRVVLLLDNVEPLISVETLDIADAELDESLRALLHGAHSALKVILTTRVAPRGLNLCEPGRQRVLTLDSGLEQKYAVEMLREMDVDGKLGLKSADLEALKRAYERTLGFPRALEALFAILASDRYTTLDELLAMSTPENVVEALVGEAFNRLDTNAQKVMQALAVYNRPVTPAAVDYLLAPHIPAIDSAPILQRLANMHFARKESGRFYLHPVDREFAFELIAKGKKKKDRDNSDRLHFTKYALLERAADFFAQARKPRSEWKKLNDINAQLSEFDLRYAIEDYNAVANVLYEVDSTYLLILWGHSFLVIYLQEKLRGKLTENDLIINNLNQLGVAYRSVGRARESLDILEQALKFNTGSKTSVWQREILTNLGFTYAVIGNLSLSIDAYKQALIIAQQQKNYGAEGIININLAIRSFEIGNYTDATLYSRQSIDVAQKTSSKYIEAYALAILGASYLSEGKIEKALKVFKDAKDFIDSTDGFPATKSRIYWFNAQAFISIDNLSKAREIIHEAYDIDVAENNHNISTLLGIIALRQGEEVAARGAFLRAIGQADEILSKTAEYYSALDAKGLSICGLAICDASTSSAQVLRLAGRGAVPAPDDAPSNVTGREDPAPTVNDAIETFQKARKIAPHAGIVKATLRLFDELAKCDAEGILKEVRKAAEGAENP